MSLPVYMYEDNYDGRPWHQKSMPQTQSRRISYDSFMERPEMHSREASINSSISSLSSGRRNKLQRKHSSTPPSWVYSSQPTNKPLPSLPVWPPPCDVSSTEEPRQGLAQAAQAGLEAARREAKVYAQSVDQEKRSASSVRPEMPDFGDSWVMDRPRRTGTYTSKKKGFKFYCEAIANFRNRKN